jgi:hypothetical protein
MSNPYEILKGTIDLHVHALPDLLERPLYELDVARQAKEVGYRGILFKSHFTTNADRIQIIRKLVDGIELFGGVTLNHSVGGINSQAVFAAIGMGAKEVKMPTTHAARHLEVHGQPNYPWSAVKMPHVKGITILDEAGKPVPELREVLELVAAHDLILSTGHLSKKEIVVLIGEARSAGVKKIVVTHADIDTTDLTVDDQLEMAQMGAFIEHSFTPCMPMRQRLDPRMIAKAIQRVGAKRCIMSSDFGQMHNPLPIEGMRMFIQHMLKCGITQEQIDIMTKYNPAKLLDLE